MGPVFGHGRLRLYLLNLLDESPRHGYDVIRELEDLFLGLYSPSAGTVYPRLARLEAEGLVEHEVVEGRKVYRVTDAGRSELAGRRAELDDLEREISGSVRDLASEIRGEVRGSVRDLRAELKAAAKDVRRRRRHAGRRERAAAGDAASWEADLEHIAEAVRAELRTLWRHAPLTRTQLTEVQAVLRRTLEDLRHAVEPDEHTDDTGARGAADCKP